MRVLIVDDESQIRRLLLRMLRRVRPDWHICAEADDGEQALRAVIEHTPDIVFLDVVMAGKSGIEALEAFSAHTPFPAVVMISGYSDFPYVKRAMQLGAVDYLLKPFDQQELEKSIVTAEQFLAERIERTKAHKAWQESMWLSLFSGNPLTPDEAQVLPKNGEMFVSLLYLPPSLRAERVPDIGIPQDAYDLCLLQHPKSAALRVLVGSACTPCSQDDTEYLILRDGRAASASQLSARMHRLEARMYALPLSACHGTVCLNTGDPERKPDSIDKGVWDMIHLFVRGVVHTSSRGSGEHIQQAIKVLIKEIERLTPWTLQLMHTVYVLVPHEICFSLNSSFEPDPQIAHIEAFLEQVCFSPERLCELMTKRLAVICETCRPHELDAPGLAQHIRRYLEANYSENISLDDLSDRFFVSKQHMSQLFKKAHGETIFDSIQRLRIRSAQELLTRSLLPVAEIAAMVGYDDLGYFGRIFRREVGVSPSAYRSKGAHEGG